MLRASNPFALFNPWLAWYQFSLGAMQMMMDSTQVIGLRTNRLLKAGASPGIRDRAEMARMGQEKVIAAAESAASVIMGIHVLNSRIWMAGVQQMMAATPMLLSLASSRTAAQASARQARVLNAAWANAVAANGRMLAAVPQIANKGLRPVRTRARANVRRLRTR